MANEQVVGGSLLLLHCVASKNIVLLCFALHYIETHPGSIHRSSSHREEMSRNAMKHGSVASITLMSCCGSWVTSFWGFLHSVLAQIYNRKQMLEETHIEPGWVWDETQARALMMRPVQWCEMWGWELWDLWSAIYSQSCEKIAAGNSIKFRKAGKGKNNQSSQAAELWIKHKQQTYLLQSQQSINMNRQTRESKPGFRLSFTYNRSIPIWGRGAPFVPAPRYKHVDDYICTEMHWTVQRTQRSQMCMIQCVIHTNVFVQIKWTIVASASRFRTEMEFVTPGGSVKFLPVV